MRKRYEQPNKGRPPLKILGDRNETVFDRNTIFHAIFDGKKVKPTQMFSSIRYYTPSGYPRHMPHINDNVEKFNVALLKFRERETKYQRHCKLLKSRADDPLETALDMQIESFMARVNDQDQ